ncbi:hypothetical protein MO387_20600 [Shewanella sp. N2AIL]|uniref:hypothetical protein n=1 Tax=Shewanella sp. N2AIL TaxID=2926851 RepID=UPI001F5815F5|nr:hypothetical protein [Shewanella sp. N2AIL]MCI2965454.1 hypothetical protein [Shewanella sp. N2AIL]
MNKDLRKISKILVLGTSLVGVGSPVLASDDRDLVNIVKSYKMQSCNGNTIEKIVNGSVRDATWSSKAGTASGDIVTIEGWFKQSGALMAMQYEVKDDKTLDFRLMLSGGMLLSMPDRMQYMAEMCRVAR